MLGDLIQQLPVFCEDLLGFFVALIQNRLHFPIYPGRSFLRAIQVGLVVKISIGNRCRCHQTQLVGHTVQRHHMLGGGCCPLDIVGSAGGLHTEHHLLGSSAAYQSPQLCEQFFLGVQVLFLLGHLHGIAQCTGGMGYDGDFGNGLGMLLQRRHQSVTYFVVGNDPLFRVGQHGVFLFRAGDHRFKGHQQVFLANRLSALADSPKGGFVYKVCKVSAHCAGSCLGDLLQVYIFTELDLLGMHLQGIKSSLQVGFIHLDPAVETAGTEQGFVQNFRAVGCRQYHKTLGAIEAVNFAKQLVQGLFLLGIAAVTGVTGATHRINFIDEDNGGSNLCSLLEQISYTACAHAHEHFHKVRAGNGEERHIGFACNCLGKEGLTRTGRAYQKGALGQLCADLCVLLRIMQEVNDLLQRFLCLILTGYISEGDAGLLFHIHFGLAVAKATHHAPTRHPLGDGAHQKEGHKEHTGIEKDHNDGGIILHDHLIDDDTHIGELICQGQHIAALGQACEAGFSLGSRLFCLLPGQKYDPVVLQLHFLQIAIFHGGDKIVIVHFPVLAASEHIIGNADHQHHRNGDHQRRPYTFRFFAVWLFFVFVFLLIQGIPLLYFLYYITVCTCWQRKM